MQIRILSAALIAAFALAACSSSQSRHCSGRARGASAASPAAASDKVVLDIAGAGAAFPQPIYLCNGRKPIRRQAAAAPSFSIYRLFGRSETDLPPKPWISARLIRP